jgi:hypothetical protein
MTNSDPAHKRPSKDLPGTIVYAVLLVPFGKLPESKQRKQIAAHPLARKKAPVFYVGQSRLEAEDRYANHLAGYKSSRVVEKYGRKLVVLDKWKPVFPVAISPKVVNAIYLKAQRNKGDAKAREAAVATLLRQAGFYVISS